MSCMMCVSVEMIFHWSLLLTLDWENEPELKETTVNNFQLRDYRSIKQWVDERQVCKTIRQKRMGFSISSLDVTKNDYPL